MNENTNNKIDVLYNDSCPVCRREIEIYKSRSNGINFKDSSLMEDKYNRRMHAYKDGVEYIGAEAFLVVWEKTELRAHSMWQSLGESNPSFQVENLAS